MKLNVKLLQQLTFILGFFGLLVIYSSQAPKTRTGFLSVPEKYAPYILALALILLLISFYLKQKLRKLKAEAKNMKLLRELRGLTLVFGCIGLVYFCYLTGFLSVPEKYVPYVLALTLILFLISFYLTQKLRKPYNENNRFRIRFLYLMLAITVVISAYFYWRVIYQK